MKVSVLFLLLAALLFLLSVVPKIQRPWMVAIGMTLLALSFTPYFQMRLGG